MDNGRHNAIFSTPEASANLNEKDWQKSLEISTPTDLPSPEHLSESIDASVNAAENSVNPTPSSETAKASEPNAPGTISALPGIGQIVSTNTVKQDAPTPLTPTSASIKTTGDRLDRASLDVIDHAIDELNQSSNLETFYDEVRSMTEANLSNSFNRKLYQPDGGTGGNS